MGGKGLSRSFADSASVCVRVPGEIVVALGGRVVLTARGGRLVWHGPSSLPNYSLSISWHKALTVFHRDVRVDGKGYTPQLPNPGTLHCQRLNSKPQH